MKKNIFFILLLILTIAIVHIIFFRSGTVFLAETLGPAFRSNAAAMLQANASSSITTPIGAKLQNSLPRGNFSHVVAKPSKINLTKKENTEQTETQQIETIFHKKLDKYLETVKQLNNTLNQTSDKQQIQQAVTACRNSFKTINFFIDYFDAENKRSTLAKIRKQCTRSSCISPRRFTGVR